MPALPANAATAPAQAASTNLAALQQALSGLKSLDWATLDAAREVEGATYAATRQARGRVPLHDKILLAGRPKQDRPPVAEAARRHLDALAYPVCDGSATAVAYADLLRRVSAITRTEGLAPGLRPLPAIGGAL